MEYLLFEETFVQLSGSLLPELLKFLVVIEELGRVFECEHILFSEFSPGTFAAEHPVFFHAFIKVVIQLFLLLVAVDARELLCSLLVNLPSYLRIFAWNRWFERLNNIN